MELQGRVMALLITSVGMCRLIVYGVLAARRVRRDPARRSTLSAAARSCWLGCLGGDPRVPAHADRGLAPRPRLPRSRGSRSAPPSQPPGPASATRNRRMRPWRPHPHCILLGGTGRRLEPALPARRPRARPGGPAASTRPPPRVDALVHESRTGDPGRPSARRRRRGRPARGRRRAAISRRCLAWARRLRRSRRLLPARGIRDAAAAVVADLLGLPAPGLRAARVCRNKYLQRRYLAAWSPRSDARRPATGRDGPADGWTGSRRCVKPVGRSASSGRPAGR